MSRDSWMIVNMFSLVLLGAEGVLSFLSLGYGLGLSFHPQFWSGLIVGVVFVVSLFKSELVKV